MKKPESYLRTLLGDETSVTVLDKEVDLLEVVAIPHGDLEDVLYDHVERVAAWRTVSSRCRSIYNRAVDDHDNIKSARFVHYWGALEEKERQEMAVHLHEDVPSEDPFKRRRWAKDRVAQGVQKTLGRWRRNFTDDLVWGYVNNDEAVALKRMHMRKAKKQLDIAEAIVETLEHRMRCISHLCARDRA